MTRREALDTESMLSRLTSALYILRPSDVPADGSPDAYYSRGLAVH